MPDLGGNVLMLDGKTIKTMTADELKAAPQGRQPVREVPRTTTRAAFAHDSRECGRRGRLVPVQNDDSGNPSPGGESPQSNRIG